MIKSDNHNNQNDIEHFNIYPKSSENQGMNESNYCPIHGLKRHGDSGGEGKMEIGEENNQGINPEGVDIFFCHLT